MWLRRLSLVLLLTLLLPLSMAAAAPPDDAPPLPVYYLGPDDEVRRALFLSDRVESVADPSQASVVVVNQAAPLSESLTSLAQRIPTDSRIILLLGAATDEAALGTLLGFDVRLHPLADPQSLLIAHEHSDPFIRRINWLSAPQVRARYRLEGVPLTPILLTSDGETAIGVVPVEGARLWLVMPWFSDPSNAPLREWAYFNYTLYALVHRAAGVDFLRYADFPTAPVPHRQEQVAIVLLVAAMLLGTGGAFVLVRRHSRHHPEALHHIVADVQRFQAHEGRDWHDIGFHRPLAGFLLLLSIGLILFTVLAVYQQVILFGMLLPSAQARGIWSLIQTFFSTFWLLFDWGTSTAFVKFYAQHRIKAPAQELKYAQFYVWWQAMTGTVQLSLVILLAAFVVPETANAFLSYFIVAHALIQFPGFLRIFQYTFRALQRQDYDQTLNIVLFLFPVLLQSATVFFFARWGAGHSAFGPALGGLLGLGIGAYLTEWSAFFIGYLMLKRLGYNAAPLFMAHFDRQTAVSAIKFGLPITLAGVAGALGFTIQATLTAQMLTNWTEIQGNWDVVGPGGLLLAYAAVGGLFYGMMPSISEAFHHQRLALTRYYIAQGFKYGGLISAFVASALLGMGDRFILGALGPDFTRAAGLVGVMAIWGLFQFPAWLSDRLQEGAGRPDLLMWMLFLEQSVRIGLMLWLLPRLGLWGLLIAYGVALPLKDVAAWLVNGRFIFPFCLPFWQAFGSPLLAALVNIALLRLLGAAIWSPSRLPSILLFAIGLLPMLPIFCFFNGLFGGWDDGGLAELRRAAEISGCGRPLALLMHRTSALGARLSPWHNRFPIPREEAMGEARSLTEERVTLA